MMKAPAYGSDGHEKARVETERRLKIEEFERRVEQERHARESEDLSRLYGAIAKVEGSKATSEDAISSIIIIRKYLSSPKSEFKHVALNAIKTRLISARSPSEVELLFDSLPDAGASGLDVAIQTST
jgi:hypothetical protein